MSEPDLPPDPDAELDTDERRFSLSVWPQTAARAWQAEVRAAGAAAPIRFDRPVDLVVFLIELSRATDWQPRGLR